MIVRRDVLKLAAGVAGAALLPARFVFAAAPTEKRLVVLILRGGLDGLTAVPPYADKRYAALRPAIAVPPPGRQNGAHDLDGTFGLHPALAPLAPWFDAREMLIVHAAGMTYRDRSHFDGQNTLENGSGKPFGAPDGWLNRALAALHSGGSHAGLAVGQSVPLILRGAVEVRTFAPTRLPAADEDFLSRVQALYQGDPVFARAFAAAMMSEKGLAGEMSRDMRGGRTDELFAKLSEAAGRLLAERDGARVAVIDSTGWDTHTRQPARLEQQLSGLAAGLVGLRTGLEAAWSETLVLVVTEFGRTAAENGNQGTDHGVGGVAFAAGGRVAGGRVAGDWPGLSERALYQGRDLRPTTELRALFKAALRDHLGLAPSFIEDKVFPNSREVAPFEGLVRRA